MRFLRLRNGRSATPALAVFSVALLLAGCNLLGGGGTDIDVIKPVTLHPESDLFQDATMRSYSLTEGVVRSGKDTTFTARTLEITALGDTTIDGILKRRLSIAGGTAPAAALSQLGLNPAHWLFDTVALPDPGPGLRFPDSPKVGWSLDTTVGALRHVRRLTQVETVRAATRNIQCWVFSDSVYWGAKPVALETYWLGANGLVKHRREWKDHVPSGTPSGTLWRELRATN
jgi:predicted small secreted protein